MTVPSSVFDAVLRRGDLAFALRAVIVMMVCLGTLAAATNLTLSRTVTMQAAPLKGRLTVEIPPPESEPAHGADRIAAIRAALESAPEVAAAHTVSEDEVARLLKPWMDDPGALPLPTLIDVQIKDGTDPDKAAAALRQTLTSIEPAITLDSHESWSAARLNMLSLLGGFADLAALFALATLGLMIALIARIALMTQRDTLAILHVMGATQKGIVRRFQRSVIAMTWPAALVGAALAAVPLGILAHALTALLAGPSIHAAWIAAGTAILCAPILTILIAALAARMTARAFAPHRP